MGRFDEGVRVVDEMNSKMRSNMERVLRAMDVIPPFDSLDDPAVAEGEHASVPSAAHAEDVGYDDIPVSASALPERVDEIPTLDLGEKILAEQRRMTSRTRRGPGAPAPSAEGEAEQLEEELVPPIAAAEDEDDSDDVAQLQQIVAEIVARDIERLCKGLKHAACCSTG